MIASEGDWVKKGDVIVQLDDRIARANRDKTEAAQEDLKQGIKQAERVAAWLDGHLPDTTKILVSPADRAQQTALALKRKFRVVQDLATGASATGAASFPCAPAASQFLDFDSLPPHH